MNYKLILFCLLCIVKINAQNYNIESLQKVYPSTAILYTLKDESAEIAFVDEKLSVVKHVIEEHLILNETGKAYNSKVVYTDMFIEIKNIKATNYYPDGKNLKKINVDDIKQEDANSSGNVFYSGHKKITITYPVTTVGSIVRLEYDEIYKEPRFFGSFYLLEYYPVLKSKFSLKYNNNVVINYKEHNLENVKTTKIESKNHRNITWEMDSLKGIKFEDYGPSYKKIAASLLMQIQNYTINNKTTEVVGTVDNLYKWYTNLTQNLNKSSSAHIQQLTEGLVKDCKTDFEKLKSIYYWVQNNVSYVAYEDGLGGFVPREADLICKRLYGDCKDMASLLTNMGKYAKLPIYLTWIGTRDLPYQFTEEPAPSSANHMIASYYTKDTCLFLDATGKNLDLGLPSDFIQEKQAIIGLNDTEYVIKQVPIVSSKKNSLLDSLILTVTETTLKGKGYMVVDGYFAQKLRNRLTKSTYKEQFDFLNGYSQKGNNKYNIDTFYVVQNERDKKIIVCYEFKIPDYVTNTNTEQFINLNLDRNFMENFNLPDDRKYELEFNAPFLKELKIVFNVPNNQKLNYIPNSTAFENDNFNYKTTYNKVNEKQIIYSSTINVNEIVIPTNHFTDWSTFMNQLNKSNTKTISILK